MEHHELPRSIRYKMVGYLYSYDRTLRLCASAFPATVPSPITRRLSLTAGCTPHGRVSRPTERIALDNLHGKDVMSNRRIVSTIDRLIRDSDVLTQRLIRMVYLIDPKHRKALSIACDCLGISKQDGYQIVTDFCRRMAVELQVLRAG